MQSYSHSRKTMSSILDCCKLWCVTFISLDTASSSDLSALLCSPFFPCMFSLLQTSWSTLILFSQLQRTVLKIPHCIGDSRHNCSGKMVLLYEVPLISHENTKEGSQYDPLNISETRNDKGKKVKGLPALGLNHLLEQSISIYTELRPKVWIISRGSDCKLKWRMQ